MTSGPQGFSQMVQSHLGWLQQTHHFRVVRSDETQVLFATPYCQVAISLERGDLFVDVASGDSEPIRRIKCSLNELLAAKGIDPQVPGGVCSTVDQQLRVIAALLAEHGGDVLAGDFSIRSRIVEVQVRSWLEDQYQVVMVDRRYPTIEEGLRQVAWEYSRQTQERKAEAYRQLEGTDAKRIFAEQVLGAWRCLPQDAPKGIG